MDTLSSSVSTLRIPALPSSSRHLYPSKTPSTYHSIPLLSSAPKSNSNSNSTITQISSLNSIQSASQFSSLKSIPSSTHRNPATGYAAALVDTLQSNNCSLDSAANDARRLSRVIQGEGILSVLSDPDLGEKYKGGVIKELGKIGGFNRFVVRLMKLLVERNKVGILNQVVVEFQRICDELSGTKVVLVSSNVKMDECQVFGIAQTVQKLTGAMQVKVRNMVHHNISSFAV